MAIVEARQPDGKVVGLTEVNLTESGLLILIADHEGHQLFIHRYGWDDVVKAVHELFEEEKRRAQEWLRAHPSEDD